MLLNQTVNRVEFRTGKSRARLQRNRFDPKLRLRVLALDVNVGWLVRVTCVKEEAVRTMTQDCRHLWTLPNRMDVEKVNPSGGAYFREETLWQFPKAIAAKAERIQGTLDGELWSSPLAFLLLLTIATLEWALRKRWQLK